MKSNINYYQSRNLDAFTEYQFQDTILKLRQGFGRLIRSYSDMGVCIITDQRIATKRYGMHIINSLPVEPNFYSNKKMKKTGLSGIFAASLELTKEGAIKILQEKLFD